MHPLAAELLEEQTRFWMRHFSGRELTQLLKSEWPHVYAALDSMSLNEAFSETKVRDIAHRYALEMEVSGPLIELVGDIAGLVFQSPHNHLTTLSDIVGDSQFDGFLEKTFESGGVLDRATQRVRESEAFRALLADLLMTVIKGSLSNESGWLGKSGVGRGARVLKNWIGERAPDLTESLEESARRFVDGSVVNTADLVLAMLEHDRYRDTVMNGVAQWWERVKHQPLSTFSTYLSTIDLQEYIALLYEYWLELRSSDYIRSAIDAGIAQVYRTYGDESLQTILREMGVSEKLMREALTAYGGDVARFLTASGLAEDFIRRHLLRFYASDSVRTLLKSA